jgi:DNA repair protein RadC
MKKEKRVRRDGSAAASGNQTLNRASVAPVIDTKKTAAAGRQPKGFRYPLQPQEWKVVSLRECPMRNPLCQDPAQAASYWRKHVATHPNFTGDTEWLVGLMLDVRRRVKGHYLVATGLADTVLIHPREVFRVAIVANSSAVIMIHNHPSGDPTPSDADIRVAKELIRAGELLKIQLLDSVIVGGRGFVSLNQLGYFDEEPKRKAAVSDKAGKRALATAEPGECEGIGRAAAEFFGATTRSECITALKDLQSACDTFIARSAQKEAA